MNESLAFGCKWRGQGSKQRHNQKQPDKFLRSFKDMRQQTIKNAVPRCASHNVILSCAIGKTLFAFKISFPFIHSYFSMLPALHSSRMQRLQVKTKIGNLSGSIGARRIPLPSSIMPAIIYIAQMRRLAGAFYETRSGN